MCVSHKISVLIKTTKKYCISLNLVQFSSRQIFNPGPSQCVPLLRIFLSFDLTDMVKKGSLSFLAKVIFSPDQIGPVGQLGGKHMFRGSIFPQPALKFTPAALGMLMKFFKSAPPFGPKEIYSFCISDHSAMNKTGP